MITRAQIYALAPAMFRAIFNMVMEHSYKPTTEIQRQILNKWQLSLDYEIIDTFWRCGGYREHFEP